MPSQRTRRLSPRRAASLALGGLAAALLAVGSPAGPGSASTGGVAPHAAPAATCIPIPPAVTCPTPAPTPTPKPTPKPTPTPTAAATATATDTPTPTDTATPSDTSTPPSFPQPTPTDYTFPPQTVPPTLPGPSGPPGTGTPPPPPDLVVQRLVLLAATSDSVVPGSSVAVEVIAEATRGTDTYSVPHTRVTLSITSSSGAGAAVVPDSADTGEVGAATVTVITGDQAGDTIVHATVGEVSQSLVLQSVQATPSTTPTATSPTPAGPLLRTVGTAGPGVGTGRAILAAAVATVVGAALMLVAVRLRPGMLRGGRGWGWGWLRALRRGARPRRA